MKSRLLSILLSTTLALIVFFGEGCRKPSMNPPFPSKPTDTLPVPRLLSIKDENGAMPIEWYEYNAQGLLTKITNHANAGIPVYFSYDQTGKPAEAKTFDPGGQRINDTYKFYYAGDRLERMEMLHTNFDQTSTLLLWTFKNSYENGRLTGSESYMGNIGQANLASRVAYLFYPNGDVKTERTEERDFATGTFHLLAEKTYEYDTKRNPMKKWGEFLPGFGTFFYASWHNVTKQVTMEGDARKVVEILTRSYTYNERGYPLSAEEKVQFPQDTSDPGITQKLIYTYQ